MRMIAIVLALIASVTCANAVVLDAQTIEEVRELSRQLERYKAIDERLETEDAPAPSAAPKKEEAKPVLGAVDTPVSVEEKPKVAGIGLMLRPSDLTGDPIWITKEDGMWKDMRKQLKVIVKARIVSTTEKLKALGITPAEK